MAQEMASYTACEPACSPGKKGANRVGRGCPPRAHFRAGRRQGRPAGQRRALLQLDMHLQLPRSMHGSL